MAKVQASKTMSLILIDEIKEILYFPIWWYAKGFFKALNWCWNFISDFEQTLGLMIWVKNLFVPMFGQRDIAGRLISFGLRLFQIFWKGIVMIIIVGLMLILIIIWLILPIFIIYQIIYRL